MSPSTASPTSSPASAPQPTPSSPLRRSPAAAPLAPHRALLLFLLLALASCSSTAAAHGCPHHYCGTSRAAVARRCSAVKSCKVTYCRNQKKRMWRCAPRGSIGDIRARRTTGGRRRAAAKATGKKTLQQQRGGGCPKTCKKFNGPRKFANASARCKDAGGSDCRPKACYDANRVRVVGYKCTSPKTEAASAFLHGPRGFPIGGGAGCPRRCIALSWFRNMTPECATGCQPKPCRTLGLRQPGSMCA